MSQADSGTKKGDIGLISQIQQVVSLMQLPSSFCHILSWIARQTHFFWYIALIKLNLSLVHQQFQKFCRIAIKEQLQSVCQSLIDTFLEIQIARILSFMSADIITLYNHMASKQQLTNFFVRLPNGNGCSFQLSSQLSLQKLVSFLQKTMAQLPKSFRLVFQGKPIKSYSLTLTQIGIVNNSIIHIQPLLASQHRSSRIDIAFLLNGDKFVVQESSHKTIWDLKHGISTVTGINPSNQVLVFLGKRLKNHRTLQHYKLTSDSLLCLLVQYHKSAKQNDGVMIGQSIDLSSALNMQKKQSNTSKTTLFRSDSINKKKVEQLAPFKVEIHQQKIKNLEQYQQEKQIDFDFLNSYRIQNMFGSISFKNQLPKLSLEHPGKELDSQNQYFSPKTNIFRILNSKVNLSESQEYKSVQLDE